MDLRDLKRLRLLCGFISGDQMPLDPTLDLKDLSFCLKLLLISRLHGCVYFSG